MIYIQNLIAGGFCPPISGTYLDNINPSTGQIYAKIPDSDARDIQNAVAAAQQAAPLWAKTSPETRSLILGKIATLIEEKLDELALAESVDNGKTLSLAKRMDIPRAAHNFRFFAQAILHQTNACHPQLENGQLNYTLQQPIGVVGCISPWNLPLYLFSWKIAPALAAGNCVIAKPSEITPMTAYLLAQICQEAGLPAGVLNMVHGLGAKVGDAISRHPQIKAISFTGGTSTGAEIAKIAAPMFKKLSLELGGKNPMLIFADCDYPNMLDTAVRAAFSNQGQICLCASRIFVQKPIYERFKADFVARTQALRIGNPLDPSTDIGAVVSKQHQEKVLGYIQLAQTEGGQVLTGGQAVRLEGECAGGYFIQPTIIEGLSPFCRTNQEEIFGAVVSIMPFETETEAIGYANASEYGLAGTVWTQDLSCAMRVSEQLQTGIVWVNTWLLRDLRTPFGGVKNSGVGREGGWKALEFFTESKNVCIKY